MAHWEQGRAVFFSRKALYKTGVPTGQKAAEEPERAVECRTGSATKSVFFTVGTLKQFLLRVFG